MLEIVNWFYRNLFTGLVLLLSVALTPGPVDAKPLGIQLNETLTCADLSILNVGGTLSVSTRIGKGQLWTKLVVRKVTMDDGAGWEYTFVTKVRAMEINIVADGVHARMYNFHTAIGTELEFHMEFTISGGTLVDTSLVDVTAKSDPYQPADCF
jgi:hypothetical protein